MNSTTTITEHPRRRRGMVGPTILIGLGVILLLNSLGLLGWDVWSAALRLWPVLLIAVGLDLLIGRRSASISALIALAMVGTIGVAVWWGGAWLTGGALVTGEAVSQPLGEATRADVRVAMSIGTLRIGALEPSSQLIEGTIAHRERDQVLHDFSAQGDTASYTLRLADRNGMGVVFAGNDKIVWDLRLNRDIPLRLKLDLGVGMSTLDLTQLHIADLDMSAGVGTTTLTLPRQGHVTARVSGGVGEMTILIPAGVAARITAENGLGNLQVAMEGYQGQATYVSPGYETAANRVDLTVHGGIGNITIRESAGQ